METATPRVTVKAKPYQRRVLDLPPCLVCSGKGSGIHYGVNTCQGCKVFFQRSLKRGEPFVCKQSGSCKIIDSNRGNCPACRMDKCLVVGMSRDGIRMGRYTLTERTLKIKEVKKLQAASKTESFNEGSSIPSVENNARTLSDHGSEFSSPPPSECSQGSSLCDHSPYTLRFREHFSEPEGSMESMEDNSNTRNTDSSSISSLSSDGPGGKICLFTEVLRHKLSLRRKEVVSSDGNKDSDGSSRISGSDSASCTTSILPSKTQSCHNSVNIPRPLNINGVGCHDNSNQSKSGPAENFEVSAKHSTHKVDRLFSEEEETFLNEITKSFRAASIEPDLSTEEIRAKLTEAYMAHQYKVQLFGPMKALSMEEYKHVRKETGLDVDGRVALAKEWNLKEREYLELYVSFAHTIPGFADLPARDQISLLKTSLCEFDTIVNSRMVEADLEMIWLPTGQILHLDQVCMFDSMETCKEYFELCKKIQQMDLTNRELALTTCVGLMFRDRCRLQNPGQVERIQFGLISLLQKLLTQRCEDPHKGRRLFLQIMDFFVRIRDLYESNLKNWKELSKDEFVREIIPNIDAYVDFE